MAIKYYHIPEQKKTIAVLSGTRFDAIHMIEKRLADTPLVLIDRHKYMMSDSYRAVVVCHADDVYNEQVGKDVAKKKLMEKYYNALDSKIMDFCGDLYDATSKFMFLDCHGCDECEG